MRSTRIHGPSPQRHAVRSTLLLAWLAAVAAPAATQTTPADRAALEARLAAAEAARDWTAALEPALALNEAAEDAHLDALYLVASLHARLGRAERAYEFLERVQQAGLFDVQRLRRDDAFASMREEPRFKAIAQAIWLRGYLWILERPERDAYQDPDRVMEVLAFREGDRVADVGAGSGYFTRRISRAVGPSGVVWAVDLRREILAVLEERARRDGLANIRVQQVDADDPQLPAGRVDTVIMVDTLHYVKDRAAYAARLRAALAPGGRVVIIDFRPKPFEQRPWGPPPEQKMSREEVDAAMASAGLFPARVHEFLTEQFFVEYRPR